MSKHNHTTITHEDMYQFLMLFETYSFIISDLLFDKVEQGELTPAVPILRMELDKRIHRFLRAFKK